MSHTNNSKMPLIFIGHGSPMNAIEENDFTKDWQSIAAKIPKPKTILCISAHWYGEGSYVTTAEKMITIYDFFGFPQELYSIKYKAKGSPELAENIAKTIKNTKVGLDSERGLDHGAWVVLRKMYPKADIPVIQLSIDGNLSSEQHFNIGKELSALRKEGVLIIGSGNIVHNLGLADFDATTPFPWAVDFDSFVKKSLQAVDTKALLNYLKNKNGILAHPTDDHFAPLFYVIGAADKEKPQFFVEKMFAGSLSMRCVAYGL